MLERSYWQKMPARQRSVTALEPEETLVHDVRANLTPTQMVEDKLRALLGGSDRSGRQNTSFQMADAMQEGGQRATADRRTEDSAVKRTVVHFLQMVEKTMPESAPIGIPLP